MMPDYEVFARKYRPQKFQDVVGQDAIVTTLINAIKQKRLGHAYLFAGPHGTGKTSIARLFAKALNCKYINSDSEPCNQCSSCQEIQSGISLDVLEIDGASYRGIEDIRKLNDTIGYASSGKYKIYLIDEVHMLTKEAFNALLKSLEEPPVHVKFFFATTEAHLIPTTILSRCQRLNFKRISPEKIGEKLEKISKELGLQVEKEAFFLVAHLAEGGMRDAESLFDELVSYQKGHVTCQGVRDLFGIPEQEIFLKLDKAQSDPSQIDYAVAFDIVEHLFHSGKNITYFLDGLMNHYRLCFLHKKPNYSQNQLLEILEILCSAHQEMKQTPSKKTFLELLLLRILKTKHSISVTDLVSRLEKLEQKLTQVPKGNVVTEFKPMPQRAIPPVTLPPPQVPSVSLSDTIPQGHLPNLYPNNLKNCDLDCAKTPGLIDHNRFHISNIEPIMIDQSREFSHQSKSNSSDCLGIKEKNRAETLMRFAAIELNGSLKKKEE